ncbi:hypothetical protein [Sphingomonas sp.]|uniref:hypothetical protein n=1 Tax=Sphingomonas sp. TaxID=28214 RepID=UPI001830529E|nr:hypothetical protein [Sphingomonas sp.]MBA3512558.1 hypothetical protein [Sphingomonas sp.]
MSYKRVTGEQLQAAIVNKQFVFAKPQTAAGEIIITSPRCDRFYPDGTYVMCGDRVPFIPGMYAVSEDQVCAATFRTSWCWRLYERAGHYLLERIPLDRSARFERVEIKSL